MRTKTFKHKVTSRGHTFHIALKRSLQIDLYIGTPRYNFTLVMIYKEFKIAVCHYNWSQYVFTIQYFNFFFLCSLEMIYPEGSCVKGKCRWTQQVQIYSVTSETMSCIQLFLVFRMSITLPLLQRKQDWQVQFMRINQHCYLIKHALNAHHLGWNISNLRQRLVTPSYPLLLPLQSSYIWNHFFFLRLLCLISLIVFNWSKLSHLFRLMLVLAVQTCNHYCALSISLYSCIIWSTSHKDKETRFSILYYKIKNNSNYLHYTTIQLTQINNNVKHSFKLINYT